MNKLMKKVAAVGLAGAMMVGGAMTALAAGPYFYVVENGTFGPARMGQDCVADIEVDDDVVIMSLQAADYEMNGTTFNGVITDAFVDTNGNLTHDENEDTLMYDDTIVYDQSLLATEVDGEEDLYANFCIEVTIKTVSGSTVYKHKPQSVYVPMQ